MAIARRKTRAGFRYDVRWRAPDGSHRSKTFTHREDAKRFEREIRRRLADQDYVSPQLSRLRFEDYFERWLAGQHHLRPKSKKFYRDLYAARLKDALGEKAIGAIRRTDVEALARALEAEGLAAWTRRHILRLLRAVLRAAAQDRYIEADPTQGLKLPRPSPREGRFLTWEQVEALAEACGHYSLFVRTAALTGLRLGELCALRVADIDFLRSRLTVCRTVSEVGGRLQEGEPKTRSSRRTVSLPRGLTEEIASSLARRGSRGDPEAYVFTSPEGAQIRPSNFRARVFQPAARRAGLEGVRFHDLRHTHASMLLSQGLPINEVQARLGHAQASITLDVYGHLLEGRDQEIAELLEREFLNGGG